MGAAMAGAGRVLGGVGGGCGESDGRGEEVERKRSNQARWACLILLLLQQARKGAGFFFSSFFCFFCSHEAFFVTCENTRTVTGFSLELCIFLCFLKLKGRSFLFLGMAQTFC